MSEVKESVKMIEMTETDFHAVMLGLNCASNAMHTLSQHREIVIQDLDGDPFPGARAQWEKAIHAAHKALGRGNYSGAPERRYAHDCEECRFIGKLRKYDVYVCPQGGHPTIIARYGDEGHNYMSSASLQLFDLRLRLELIDEVEE